MHAISRLEAQPLAHPGRNRDAPLLAHSLSQTQLLDQAAGSSTKA
jgi:hypothetical protein